MNAYLEGRLIPYFDTGVVREERQREVAALNPPACFCRRFLVPVRTGFVRGSYLGTTGVTPDYTPTYTPFLPKSMLIIYRRGCLVPSLSPPGDEAQIRQYHTIPTAYFDRFWMFETVPCPALKYLCHVSQVLDMFCAAYRPRTQTKRSIRSLRFCD